MNVFTAERIIELEGSLGNGIECIDTDELAKTYVLKRVYVSRIRILDSYITSPLNIYNFHELYDGINLYDPTYDVETIRSLMTRYENNEEMNPILLDKSGFVIDGHHRLAALNTLNVDSIEVYYPES